MNWKDKFPKENIYFETENGILYKGDCLEIMKHIPDNSIDLILTDPPFGIDKDKLFGMINWDKTNYYNKRVYELFDTILKAFKVVIWSFLYENLDTFNIYLYLLESEFFFSDLPTIDLSKEGL